MTGFTALVVEDEPLIALDTEDILRELGASEVEIVDEFAAAKAKLGDCNFGVVLFDLDLGGVSTADLVAKYRELGCRAIVVSGNDEQPEDLAGIDVHHLTKPLKPEALRSVLAETGLALPG